MDDVQAALAKVEAEIEALGVKLDKVEAEVEAARARHDKEEVAELRKEKEQLRTEKEQLRTEKEQLRTKEDKLRTEKKQQQEKHILSLLPPLGRLSVARDASVDVCARLLLPVLEALPLISSLRTFFATAPSVPLPLHDWMARQLACSPEDAAVLSLVQTESESSASALAADFGACLRWRWVAGNEQHTLIAVEALLVQPLLALDRLAPMQVRLRPVLQRDTGGHSSSGMTPASDTGKPLLRPDWQLRSSDGRRLLCKGEDKGEDLAAAVHGLRVKTAHWSPLFYGDLPYLPCYAAAGSSLQPYAIPRGGAQAPLPISQVFDLTRSDDRVRLLCATVHLHRVLLAVQARLPESVLPPDADLVHVQRAADGGVAWTRRVRLSAATGRAEKRVEGWRAFCAQFGVELPNVAAAPRRRAGSRARRARRLCGGACTASQSRPWG